MSSEMALLFWSLTLFEAKHFLLDFIVQKPALRVSAVYGAPKSLIHAALHGVCSVPAIFMLTQSLVTILAVMAAEFLVHYHIDWLRAQIGQRRWLNPTDGLYWTVFGIGQWAHQMTYVIVLAVLVRAGGAF